MKKLKKQTTPLQKKGKRQIKSSQLIKGQLRLLNCKKDKLGHDGIFGIKSNHLILPLSLTVQIIKINHILIKIISNC